MKIALLLTGSELMTGDIVDSNSAMIAEYCLDQGIQVAYKATVPDELDLLVSEIERLSQHFDVLIVNGGLGPTTDDMTAEALAKVLGKPIKQHEQALAHLSSWCQQRNYHLSDANKKQAMLPEGIALLANSIGSAVGFWAPHNDCQIYCTPGVPKELELMLREEILPSLKVTLPSDIEVKRLRYRVFGYGESKLQQVLAQTFPDLPACIEIGFRASLPLIELKLKVDRPEHHSTLGEWGKKIEALLGDHIVTKDQRSIAHVVVDKLNAESKTLTFAESCTGGKIASLVTEISGASAVFEAGVVSYSNEIKHRVLGVSQDSLDKYGAVSEPVVREMLAGVLELSGADIGVSVSGIAGPNGGTEEKPVGTVWVAWGAKNNIKAREFYFPGSRVFFQELVSALALDLVRRELIDSSEEPEYFRARKKPGSE